MATNDDQGLSLHDLALEAEKDLEQLATGLAQAGVDPNAVKAISKMADVVRQIASQLGQGQEQTGHDEPPAAAPQPQPETGAQSPHQGPQTLASASDHLHQAMQASAARAAAGR